MEDLSTPCLIHQPKYSLFWRWVEGRAAGAIAGEKASAVLPFSPLAGGALTDRYLNGIPEDSRAASGSRFTKPEQITADKLEKFAG